MKMRIITIVLTLAMLLGLSACGGQGPASSKAGNEGADSSIQGDNSTKGGSKDSPQGDLSEEPEAGQSSDAPAETNEANRIPTKEEIFSLLEQGETALFLIAEEEDFSPTDSISLYSVEPLDGNAVWNEFFSQYEVTSKTQYDARSNITITIDGTECTGHHSNGSGYIEFYNLPELPTALSQENLMDALSSFTGMDWVEGEPDYSDEFFDGNDFIYYQFSVDGIMVDRYGYQVAGGGAEEGIYNGACVSYILGTSVNDTSHVGILIPYRLGEKGDSLEPSDLISYEQAELLLRTDLAAAGSTPLVDVDSAKLVYYYDAQLQQLRPGWSIRQLSYHLVSNDEDEYELSWTLNYKLIDAQTGAIYFCA